MGIWRRLPGAQQIGRRFAARIVIRIGGRRRRHRPIPPEKALHPGGPLAPDGERRIHAVALLGGIVRAYVAVIPGFRIGAGGALIADFREDNRFLVRVIEVRDGGHQIQAARILPPGGYQLRQRGVALVGQREVAVEADQVEAVPEGDRGELVARRRRVGGIGQGTVIYGPDGVDHAIPAGLVGGAGDRLQLSSDAEHFDPQGVGHLRVLKHETGIACKPGVGVGRVDVAAPCTGRVAHVHVGLQHHLDALAVKVLNGLCDRGVGRRGAVARDDAGRDVGLIPGGQHARPIGVGGGEIGARGGGRGGQVLVCRPGSVGDTVVLEAADALGGGRRRRASQGEKANRRQTKMVLRAAHFATPVWVRHELAAVIASPAFRPPLPPTGLPAEHSRIAGQPLGQPTISVTRRR